VQTKNLESKTKQNNGLNSSDVNVCDELKLKCLTTPWMPDKNYVFPIYITSKKKLKFQFSWFERL